MWREAEGTSQLEKVLQVAVEAGGAGMIRAGGRGGCVKGRRMAGDSWLIEGLELEPIVIKPEPEKMK